jgi:SAM-dependent methyltransferase
MAPDPDRERLAATFDRAAELYQRARPEYPAELYDRLLTETGVVPPARLLEVGPATGKATRPLARRGFHITGIEPGAALAAVARRELAGYDVDLVVRRFEDWDPGDARFDLVYSATAWHWVDPDVRYQRAAAALRPDGHLALWEAGHVFPRDGDPIFDDLQLVYDEISARRPDDLVLPRPQELAPITEEIEAAGLFEVVDVVQYDWETTYDAAGYIDLLNTFSGHIEMEEWQRERLYGEIRRLLAERPDGTLRRHWGGVLHVARRR